MSTLIEDRARLAVLDDLRHRASGVPTWEPLPHQQTPDGAWFLWLLEAGRGAGKTATASHFIAEHLNGPACITAKVPHRVALIAPTLGDAIESATLTDMALTRWNPDARFTQNRGGSMVSWPGGGQVRLFGTHTKDDVDRLRAGGNRCAVWAEELAAWRYLEEAWSDMMFGLRLGPNPRVIATTTPRRRPAYITIRESADVLSHATTLDNPNLNEQQRERLEALYSGTSVGEQELYGRLVEEIEGALWSDADIDRRDIDPDSVGRVVVGVDPPGGATECGIVTVGVIPDCECRTGRMPHYVVLDDRSAKLSPEAWGARAISAYHELGADRVYGEANYGGDMVQSIIRTVDPSVAYSPVRASRGKRVRAEPVKALYEQKRVHHLPGLDGLESEMVSWIPDESDWSPNRIDALVWAVTAVSNQQEWKVG